MDAATRDPQPLLIFVPGIMGSELRYRGPGEFGELVDDEVWGSDPGVVLDVLARKPYRLSLAELHPTSVIRHIKGRVYGKGVDKPLYGPLIDFCTGQEGLALELDVQFVPFPYDWRKDNRNSAETLADRIRQADPAGNRPIGLIGHSMGGIICRLLLLSQPQIASRISFYLQIASPILGSAKAFHTLREGPGFSFIMDQLIGIIHHRDLQRRVDLMSVLQTFPSIYQLLPPARIPTLLTPSGQQISAVANEVWLNDSRKHAEAAREVHVILEQPLNVPITCVYSNCHETDWHYLVDTEFRIKGALRERFGDGTVVSASAFEGSDVGGRLRLDTGGTSHDELPCHEKVKTVLRELVSRMN